MEIFIHTDLNNKDIFRKSRGSADFKAGYLAPSRALETPWIFQYLVSAIFSVLFTLRIVVVWARFQNLW